VAQELAGGQQSIKCHLEKKFQGSSVQFQEKMKRKKKPLHLRSPNNS
jgi:hypothetical protein